ncbi:NAD(P)/FAD-dependent oxidoreductase [Halorhabdus amylolytica]|uniref:NAD(P)/FAD-dependent oxidoreductase n=1 Tax=Halorhabdus amylolytica TaxID=2559573 RepID=UPI0010AA4214|nr:FAD-dependent oxidoreductase [Halorhabdus amylolytica]
MRVAIFGGGYAGVNVARRLERSLSSDDELLVVDESGTHVVRHLLHRAIRRPEGLGDLTLTLDDLFDRATVREARVTDLDAETGVATLADGETIEYDVGAVCIGSEPAFYGLDGVAEHAITLHRPGDPQAVRTSFLDALADGGRTVIGGGGLTGVQVAGELAALAAERGGADRLDLRLLEQADAVPPGYDDRLQSAVQDALAGTGVTVETGVTITGASADRIQVAGGDPVEYDCLVWTGGIAGASALGDERPDVRATLRLGDRTFALGDAVRVIDADGRVVPATAQAATGQASVAAANLSTLLEHRRSGGGDFEPRLDRYRHDDAGWTISVGDEAVAKVGPKVLTGAAAAGVKTLVGAEYLSRIGAAREALKHVGDAIAEE